MEFKKTVYELKVYGHKVELRRPTVKEVASLARKEKGVQGDSEKTTELSMDFLVHLGMPREIAEQLELEHLSNLLEMLVSSKKK